MTDPDKGRRTDPDLRNLADISPSPNTEARKAALNAAMSAFDDANKVKPAPQGIGVGKRLTSIFTSNPWSWIMENRIAFGTLAAGVLLIPLAGQLMNTTSFSPLFTSKEAPSVATKIDPTLSDEVREAPLSQSEAAANDDAIGSAPSNVPTSIQPEPAPAGGANEQVIAKNPISKPATKYKAVRGLAPRDQALGQPAPERHVGHLQDFAARSMQAPVQRAPSALQKMAAPPSPVTAPGVSPTRPMRDIQSNDRFENVTENGVTAVSDEPVSTFSIDVDTASYSFVRRELEAGRLPRPDMVRVEEMINYFDYAYPAPETLERPFEPTIAVYATPWNAETQLLHIGLKGHEVLAAEKPQTNLVLLIDVSGSMNAADKLPLLKSAFRLLLGQLGADDTISIVTYAGRAGTALEPTKASEKNKILNALDALGAGGSTAGKAGIQKAYELARTNYKSEGVNRVILATDGDFNIGISDPEALKSYIAKERKDGVMLSVLGFGQGNYNDHLMQSLAQNGNGTAAYIDTLREAQKVLVEEASAALYPIAKDVKIQVEFNPEKIAEYRLIGYETRALARADFNNDKVDAGDIGSGHTVTAIYEITPKGSPAQLVDDLRYGKDPAASSSANQTAHSSELAHLKLRYKAPGSSKSQLITRSITQADTSVEVAQLPGDIRFAASVAAFGQKLRGSTQLDDFGYDQIIQLASSSRGKDSHGYRGEFLALALLAKSLSRN